MESTTLLRIWFATVVGLALCFSDFGTNAAAQSASDKRDALIDELLTRGDTYFEESEEKSQWAYKFVLHYSPDDTRTYDKWKVIMNWKGNWLGSLGYKSSITRHNRNVMDLLSPKVFAQWEEPTDAMELVELQMLLDESLVGHLRYGAVVEGFDSVEILFTTGLPWSQDSRRSADTGDRPSDSSISGLPAFVFLQKPSITLSEVNARYGEPTHKVESAGGHLVSTYGRIRLISDKTDVAAVLYHPVQEHMRVISRPQKSSPSEGINMSQPEVAVYLKQPKGGVPVKGASLTIPLGSIPLASFQERSSNP